MNGFVRQLAALATLWALCELLLPRRREMIQLAASLMVMAALVMSLGEFLGYVRQSDWPVFSAAQPAQRVTGYQRIALTSLAHSQSCASRHSSGKRMFELADVTIDNCAPVGDAGFAVEGLPYPIGPTSSAVGIAIVQALVCTAVEQMVAAGFEPPIFKSSNADGGDAHNEAIFRQYYGYRK